MQSPRPAPLNAPPPTPPQARAGIAADLASPRLPTLRRWLADLLPAPVHVGRTEQLRAWVGAALGILLTALASRWLGGGAAGP